MNRHRKTQKAAQPVFTGTSGLVEACYHKPALLAPANFQKTLNIFGDLNLAFRLFNLMLADNTMQY